MLLIFSDMLIDYRITSHCAHLFGEEFARVVDAAVGPQSLSVDEAAQQGAMNADELVEAREHLVDGVATQTDLGQQAANEHLSQPASQP